MMVSSILACLSVPRWGKFRAPMLFCISYSNYISTSEFLCPLLCSGHGHRCYSTEKELKYDLLVVGGGIIGVATARELLKRHPSLRVGVLEKEEKLAYHQTGHNSGVIHAGIYYTPGSLKAQLCVKGLHLSYKYCDEKDIPYKKVGKLIVATNKKENERLDDLLERGEKNNVPDLQVLDKKEIKQVEPACEGLRAIHSPHTGIVDWTKFTEKLGEDFVDFGGVIHLKFHVKNFKKNVDGDESEVKRYPLVISSDDKNLKSRFAVVCGGLHSDKLASISGCTSDPKIIPVRGEYLLLSPEKSNLIKGNIYPVPDPRFPFLGVHFTPRMDGQVWLGPNAVLAFKREGYRWSDVNIFELAETITYPGFLRLAFRNARFGINEMMKSISLKMQVRELQKYVPSISVDDVQRGSSGVRAQALSKRGILVDDFVFDLNCSSDIGKYVLHCRNTPSPAATSSLAISELIVDKIEKEFTL